MIEKEKINWTAFMQKQFQEPYMKEIEKIILKDKKEGKIIYPFKEDIFKAFILTPFDKIKVVIIGQEPYNDGNADGLAFSCKYEISPSLDNINKAINKSYETVPKSFGIIGKLSLEQLATQGVFLLNSSLTVVKGHAKSHLKIGWEEFAVNVINYIDTHSKYIVYLLWGKHAHEYEPLLTNPKNLIIKAQHPAAAAWKKNEWDYNNCFIKANEYLESCNIAPINWLLKS